MTDEAKIRIREKFGDEEIEVIYRPSPPPPDPHKLLLDGLGYHPPMNQRTYIEDGIRVDQDVAGEAARRIDHLRGRLSSRRPGRARGSPHRPCLVLLRQTPRR